MLTTHLSNVNDRRMRNGGYMTGPNHGMLSAAGRGPVQEAAKAPAPNYREGEPGNECMDCTHYDMGTRQCGLYNFTAKPQMTCDSFSAAVGDDAAPAAPVSEADAEL